MMAYLLVALFLLVCAIIYLKIAKKWNIVTNPNFRSSHATPTIRGCGILYLFYNFISIL